MHNIICTGFVTFIRNSFFSKVPTMPFSCFLFIVLVDQVMLTKFIYWLSPVSTVFIAPFYLIICIIYTLQNFDKFWYFYTHFCFVSFKGVYDTFFSSYFLFVILVDRVVLTEFRYVLVDILIGCHLPKTQQVCFFYRLCYVLFCSIICFGCQLIFLNS